MGVLSLEGHVCLTALQRLSALLPSSAPLEQKLEAAALVAETLTENLVADERKKEHRQKVSPSLRCDIHALDIYKKHASHCDVAKAPSSLENS